jgi:hypothetical protein
MANGNDQTLRVRLAVTMIVMSILVEVGGWMVNTHLESWGELLKVQHVGGLLMHIGGVVIAWFTANPMNLRQWTPEKGERRKNGEETPKEKP